MNFLVGPAQFTDAGLPTGSSASGGPVDDANGTSLVAIDALLAGSATTEATWRGGPWDGVTTTVVAGERFFPLYCALVAEGEKATGPLPHRQPAAHARRLCPIVPGPNGGLIIDWDAGVFRR